MIDSCVFEGYATSYDVPPDRSPVIFWSPSRNVALRTFPSSIWTRYALNVSCLGDGVRLANRTKTHSAASATRMYRAGPRTSRLIGDPELVGVGAPLEWLGPKMLRGPASVVPAEPYRMVTRASEAPGWRARRRNDRHRMPVSARIVTFANAPRRTVTSTGLADMNACCPGVA